MFRLFVRPFQLFKCPAGQHRFSICALSCHFSSAGDYSSVDFIILYMHQMAGDVTCSMIRLTMTTASASCW